MWPASLLLKCHQDKRSARQMGLAHVFLLRHSRAAPGHGQRASPCLVHSSRSASVKNKELGVQKEANSHSWIQAAPLRCERSPRCGKTPRQAFPARALSLLIAAGIQAAGASFASQASRPALAPGLGSLRLRLGQERTGPASVLPLAPGAGRALRNAAGAARVGHARVGAP